MKVWVPTATGNYALVGKFPHIYIDQLIKERKIVPSSLDLEGYPLGYRVLSPFSCSLGDLMLNVNSDFIITGE